VLLAAHDEKLLAKDAILCNCVVDESELMFAVTAIIAICDEGDVDLSMFYIDAMKEAMQSDSN
jgi:hypothetical protein